MRTFKYRIYPTKEQIEGLECNIRGSRFVYNYLLNYKYEVYKEYGVSYSGFDLIRLITSLKKELPRLEIPSIQVLQESARNLDKAYGKFFKGLNQYPKFKNKNSKKFITYNSNIKIEGNRIKIPKISPIKIKIDRPIEGKIKLANIYHTKTDKRFINIMCDSYINKSTSSEGVGIDVGLEKFAMLSDGTYIKNPRFYRLKTRKIKKYQRRLNRKNRGSKNREKMRLKIAKEYEKLNNKKYDFLHRESTIIAKRYGKIAMEKLNIEGMIKNHSLANSIAQAGWRKFKEMLSYKSTVFEIDLFKPSSKTCSRCGGVNQDLTLSDRTYHCKSCHLDIDRDLNAAINIKTMAGV